MRQIMTVGVDNTIFQIDDEAYTALRRYLDRAKASLTGNPDVNEILGDLERSIAEKCSALLQIGKGVLRSEDLHKILEEMGPVAAEVGTDAGEPEPAAPSTAAPRKLYRQTEGAKLSGVCMGLAQYFGIDVVFVRMGFIALSGLSGLGVVLYLVMEALMPARDNDFGRRYLALKLALLVGLFVTAYLWFDSLGPSSSRGGGMGLGLAEFVLVPLFIASIIAYGLAVLAAAVLLFVAALKFIRPNSRASV
jgi:phage shock protein PspC (stress-responsive transcriptional regulator)